MEARNCGGGGICLACVVGRGDGADVGELKLWFFQLDLFQSELGKDRMGGSEWHILHRWVWLWFKH